MLRKQLCDRPNGFRGVGRQHELRPTTHHSNGPGPGTTSQVHGALPEEDEQALGGHGVGQVQACCQGLPCGPQFCLLGLLRWLVGRLPSHACLLPSNVKAWKPLPQPLAHELAALADVQGLEDIIQ
eukprot:12600013-Heterocapsa_arctica.AAC.1